ncbi:uncharacterized protein [Arachis hypogaea]|uniref:uncharacterized protein isoform X1 n=1 Tax=Arachis hypogaea TaxID=3818 RepID=UPI003B22444E
MEKHSCDYYHIKKQIESDFVDGANVRLSKSFLDLLKVEQQSKLKDHLKKYCQKNSVKQESACVKIHFMLTLFADSWMVTSCWKNWNVTLCCIRAMAK